MFGNFNEIKYCLFSSINLLKKNVMNSVQSLSCVPLFATPWTAAHQASLSITNSQSLLKLMCIKPLMPSSHLILCTSAVHTWESIFSFSGSPCSASWCTGTRGNLMSLVLLVLSFLASIPIGLEVQFSSAQFSHSVMSNSLRLHESQHTRPPCASPSPRVHSDSRPSSP